MVDGRLRESRDAEKGERTLTGIPGEHCVQDPLRSKAEGYMRVVDIKVLGDVVRDV